MRNFLVGLMLVAMTATGNAQQLNVGIAKRVDQRTPVVDAVLMSPEIPLGVTSVILYGQVTAVSAHSNPELYAAAEIPVINIPIFYLGFDNGAGYSPVGNAYPEKVWFTGLTTWVSVAKVGGVYGMLSYNPTRDWARTLQVGIFHQVF